MPVYFAYRSFDLGPTGKYLKRFEDDTVLDWFRCHWEHLAIEDSDEADERLTELLGCNGWFLWNPFHMAATEGLSPPKSDKALVEMLQNYLGEDQCIGSPHCLQVFTEEDGEGGALYYFDGHFLKRSGPLAAYLLHEDWRLPSGHGDEPFVRSGPSKLMKPKGDGAGATYIVILERESKYPLDELLDGYRIEGVRLPELTRYICCLPADTEACRWDARLRRLPALLLAGVKSKDPMEAAFLLAVQADPGDAASWGAWSDFCQERGSEPPGIRLLRDAFGRMARFPGRLQEGLPRDVDLDTSCPRLLELEKQHRAELRTTCHSLIHIEDHLAQICLDRSWTDEPYFSQWIMFDDLWASAHADLANALLRFSARWDVLSGNKRPAD